MFELDLEVARKRPFFRHTATVSVRARLTAKPDPAKKPKPIVDFLEQLMTKVPQLSTIDALLRNFSEVVEAPEANCFLVSGLRGRPAETFEPAAGDRPGNRPKAQEEELFFASGVVFPVDRESDTAEMPFSIQLKSKFHGFAGSRRICYQTQMQTQGPIGLLGSKIIGLEVCRLIPLRVDTLRLGIEVFKPQFFGSMFGNMPTVKRRFYFSSQPALLDVFLEDQDVEATALPFEQERLIPALDEAFCKADMFPDFALRVQAQLAENA